MSESIPFKLTKREEVKSHYEKIYDFMQTFERECPTSPCMPSLAVRKLRAKTILEEALERIQALGFGVINEVGEEIANTDDIELEELYKFNPKEFLDGVVDGEYFDLGSLIALGISEAAYMKHFNKVHEANMGKLWTYKEIHTIRIPDGCTYIEIPALRNKAGRYAHVDENDRIYIVLNQDGKVVKPPSFKAPEVEL